MCKIAIWGNLLQTKTNEDFENICEDNSEYGNALDYLYVVNNNKDDAKRYIQQLGFSFEQYNKRIYFSYKRFKQKLYNAYILYISQKHNDFDFISFKERGSLQKAQNPVELFFSKKYSLSHSSQQK